MKPGVSDAGRIEKLRSTLLSFADNAEKAKSQPDRVEQKFKDYVDASTYATNDKDRRLKRSKY
jgi:hypothetical protein